MPLDDGTRAAGTASPTRECHMHVHWSPPRYLYIKETKCGDCRRHQISPTPPAYRWAYSVAVPVPKVRSGTTRDIPSILRRSQSTIMSDTPITTSLPPTTLSPCPYTLITRPLNPSQLSPFYRHPPAQLSTLEPLSVWPLMKADVFE